MALNRKYANANEIALPVASGVVSGKAVAVGQIPGVALIDRDSDGEATLQFDGAFNLLVKGLGNSDANTAVAIGDIVYIQANGDVSKNSAGVRFGYALGGVASGNILTTITVKIGY